MSARLRPYWLHVYLLSYTPILLFADSLITALWQQWVLGLLTFAALYLAALKAPREQRVQVWTCVVVATGFEIFGSLIWGLYQYRLHNVPLFVPPGHGAVYLFGLLAARTPVVLRYGRRVAHVILAGASTWALAGLTVLPLITGRFDLQGAMCLPIFAWFVLKSPRWPLFAAIFIATGELEIFGTFFRNWYWLPVAPWTHIPSGNPPSVIAGGYCVIDASVLLAMRALASIRNQFQVLHPAATGHESERPQLANYLDDGRTHGGVIALGILTPDLELNAGAGDARDATATPVRPAGNVDASVADLEALESAPLA